MTDPSHLRSKTGREPTSTDELLSQSFAKLHSVAFGIALGVFTGLVIFAATAILRIKGGSPVGPHLGLLDKYFIGYSITWLGSIVGLFYGFAFGFIVGWLLASLRNGLISVYLQVVKFKHRFSHLADPFE